jgi:hypothetical protein
MEVEARLSSDTCGAKTVRVAEFEIPLAIAEMVTGRLAPTGVVVMTKVGDTVWPADTVTVAGSVTLGLLLERVTMTPPAGAGCVRVTELEPVIPDPPRTDVGERPTDCTPGPPAGKRVNVALMVTLL